MPSLLVKKSEIYRDFSLTYPSFLSRFDEDLMEKEKKGENIQRELEEGEKGKT